MKSFKLLVIALILTVTSVETFGHPSFRRHHHRNRVGSVQTNPSVGAPLDGGILAVLGAAGVTYVIARKKRKDK